MEKNRRQGMADSEKTTRAKQTGTALEMDVIKKIAHQLDRGLTPDQMTRIVRFVASAVEEKKLLALKLAEKNGQLHPSPAANPVRLASGAFGVEDE
jgi:hypothetical protein